MSFFYTGEYPNCSFVARKECTASAHKIAIPLYIYFLFLMILRDQWRATKSYLDEHYQ
jgi:hypothetical protein